MFMNFSELLIKKHMSQYHLSKLSGVPRTTIVDICSSNSNLYKCNGLTLYKLSKSLGVTMEELIECDNLENIDKKTHLPQDSSYLLKGLPKTITLLIRRINRSRINNNISNLDVYKMELMQEINSCFRKELISSKQKEYIMNKYC